MHRSTPAKAERGSEPMGNVRLHFSMSLDGFVADPHNGFG
ncbi:hypothetical protein C8D87_112111 [Lentzea atacamensis]|uniref:Dihydrofolate reductase n=1 Tax=Lentzea atacamensis TaxID=531938 RepID=A0ABX9E0G6_9PSEU|nr:hypothetical protein C8D87_112111 [Lentzea atacamensis]